MLSTPSQKFPCRPVDPESCPIGVLDSGLGGLSVLSALRRTLPLEDFVYCADCGNAPWGDKTPEFIIDRCRDICGFMIAKCHAKCLVMACNTATAFSIDVLRRELTLPIIGIEPAVKPAVERSKAQKVGVIATRRTIESARYRSLVTRFAQGAEVVSIGAPGLMECVERGDFEGTETKRLVEKYLTPIKNAGVDKVVLGCTHYPFLSKIIGQFMGPEVELIEPGTAVAAVTKKRLTDNMLERKFNPAPKETFFIRGVKNHADTLRRLWPQAADPRELTA